MKNEKMKRVAALALAGTIAVSTVSPAAFAAGENEEGENENKVVPFAAGEEIAAMPTTVAERNQQTVTNNNTTVSNNEKAHKKNEDILGSNSSTGNGSESSGSTGSGDQSGGDQGSGDQGSGDQGGGDQSGGSTDSGSTDSGDQSGGSESGGSTSSNQELIDGNPTLTTGEGDSLETIEPPKLEELPALPTLPEDLPKNPSNNQEIGDYNQDVEDYNGDVEDYNNAVGVPTVTTDGEGNSQTSYPEDSYNHAVQDYNNAANQHNKDLDDKLFGTESGGTTGGTESGAQGTSGLLEDNSDKVGTSNTAGENVPSNAIGNEADLEGNAEKVDGLITTANEEDKANLAALETAKTALDAAKAALETAKASGWDTMSVEAKNALLKTYQDQVDAYNAAVEKYNHKTSNTASDGTLDKYDAAIDTDNNNKISSNDTATTNNTAAQTNNTNEFDALSGYWPTELSEDEQAALAALESLGATVQAPTITAALDEANKTLGADQKIPEGTTDISNLTPEQHKAVVEEYNKLVAAYNAAVDTYNKKASSNDQLTIIQKTYQDALAKYNAAVKSEQEAQMNGNLKPAGDNTQTNTEVDTTNQTTAGENNGKYSQVTDDPAATLPTALPDMPTLDAALAAAKQKELEAAATAANTTVDQLDATTKAAIEAKYNNTDDLTPENQDAVVAAFNTLVDEYNAKVELYNNGKEATGTAAKIDSAQEAYDAAWKAYNEKEIQKTYGTNSTTTTDAAGTGTSTSTGSGNKLTLEQNAAALEDAEKALKTIQTLANDSKITLTAEEQATLDAALNQIAQMQAAGTVMNAVGMPTLDFTGCTTSVEYNAALTSALADYTKAVGDYKTACDAYNAVNGVMDAAQNLLDAKSEAIEEANTESITASLGSLDASYDSVYGIEAAISSNNNNKNNVLSNALEKGSLTYVKTTVTTGTDGVSTTEKVTVSISDKEAAEGELAALTSAVQTEQKTIKEKLDALQELAKNPTAENYVEQYNALVQEYNAALGRCETAIANYNAFVAVCNPKPTLPPSEEQVDPKEVKLGKLTYSKNESTSPAKYYIQIKGEVPFEDQNTSYDNDYYTKVGEGYTVKDATLYPNEWSEYDGKLNMDGKNVREGHTRVDVPNATGVITNNQYNNQVINLDNVILKGAGKNGADLNLGAEGMKGNLKEQLQAYYANVYEVLGDKPNEQAVLQKILDSETYNAYEASGYTSMGVLWYVVKDSSTGTKGDDVHVDGVVYFTNSGVVYDQNRFSSMSQNLSPLEKLIDTNIRNVQALNTVTTKQHETLSELNQLEKMPTNYTKMKVDNLQAVTKVAELKNHTEDLELLQELELTKTENGETKPGDDLYANTLEFLNTLETLTPLELLPTSGGGDEDTELPPEEDFEGEDLVLILTDVPTEEEIADEATALAAGPAAEEETDIEDEDVALSGAPETGDELTDIGDAEVAKSDVPKTGDESGIFLLLSAVSGMALAALSFIDRKGRHSRFGSQH